MDRKKKDGDAARKPASKNGTEAPTAQTSVARRTTGRKPRTADASAVESRVVPSNSCTTDALPADGQLDELGRLGKEINEHHGKHESGLRDSLQHALYAGQKLLRVKELLGHGNFGKWQKENCRFSARTGQKYMRIARKWGELGANAPSTAHLTIEEVLGLLAEPAAADTENVEIDAADEFSPDVEQDPDAADGHDESAENGGTADEEGLASDSQTSDSETADSAGADRQDAQAAYKTAAKKHDHYLKRLPRFREGGHLTEKDKPVKAAVEAGMPALVKDVDDVIRKHARKACNKAVTNMGNDATFLAMVFAMRLKERLDNEELFAPKNPETKSLTADAVGA